MKTTRLTIIALALLSAASAWGENNFGGTETIKGEWPIDAEGSIWIENPIGNIEVIGGDYETLSLVALKNVRGADAAAVAEARLQTQVITTGDEHSRQLRIIMPVLRNMRWTSSVNLILHVPRTLLVKIASQSADLIKISGLTRTVTVKNTNGAVVLENVTGSAAVVSVNGNITFDPNGRPQANAQFSTVNGQISLIVPNDANFRWVAQTIAGEFKTNLPVNGHFSGTTFRGGINNSRGPTITTATMLGSVVVLRKGSNVNEARNVRMLVSEGVVAGPTTLLRLIQTPFVNGDFSYTTPLGSFDIGQIAGSAKIETGAGEVHLHLVKGECTVTSLGGPLTLDDMFGPINVKTKGGDIFINAARAGGFASTGGGMIRVLYAGATMTLHSDGGDITVIKENSPSSFDVAATIPTKLRARTMTVDEKTHDLITVTADFEKAPEATAEQPRPRPKMVPDSFVVLVYGK